jgi:hypothetical protein
MSVLIVFQGPLSAKVGINIILHRDFVKYLIQHCFIGRLSDSTVSEDAGFEPHADCNAI